MSKLKRWMSRWAGLRPYLALHAGPSHPHDPYLLIRKVICWYPVQLRQLPHVTTRTATTGDHPRPLRHSSVGCAGLSHSQDSRGWLVNSGATTWYDNERAVGPGQDAGGRNGMRKATRLGLGTARRPRSIVSSLYVIPILCLCLGKEDLHQMRVFDIHHLCVPPESVSRPLILALATDPRSPRAL